MLSHLVIKNFAIIDALEIPLRDGFTAITGETGAGKSILIDALHLLLGGRASTDVIRTGTDAATVEGIFEPSGLMLGLLNARLEAVGVPPCEGQLIVRRIVSRNGRNKVFVNGSLTTVSTLASLTRGLVDISGQHEHYSLMNTEGHVDILDAHAGVEVQRVEMADAFAALNVLRQEQRTIDRNMRERATRIDFLEFQLGEIDGAKLRPGEAVALEEELGRLRHAEKIHESGNKALYLCYESEHSAAQQLSEAAGLLARIGQHDPRMTDLSEQLEEAYLVTEEIARELRGQLLGLDNDPRRLDALIERSERIRKLQRKYGDTVEEILGRAEQMRAELELLHNAEERSEQLEAELRRAEDHALRVASALSARRHEAASTLRAKIEAELADLNMARTRFAVSCSTPETRDACAAALGERGFDEVEFLIAPNLGEELKPLARIASGGELSRVMLAMKTAMSTRDAVDTYIFDEVDTGIGGATADRVGEKIEEAARARQVLCITHLPQIASRCDHHYLVEKHHDGQRTRSNLRLLSTQERVEEIARMLGGDRVTSKTLDAASELVGVARLSVA